MATADLVAALTKNADALDLGCFTCLGRPCRAVAAAKINKATGMETTTNQFCSTGDEIAGIYREIKAQELCASCNRRGDFGGAPAHVPHLNKGEMQLLEQIRGFYQVIISNCNIFFTFL